MPRRKPRSKKTRYFAMAMLAVALVAGFNLGLLFEKLVSPPNQFNRDECGIMQSSDGRKATVCARYE